MNARKYKILAVAFFVLIFSFSICSIENTAYAKSEKIPDKKSIQLNIKKKSLVKKSNYRIRVRRTTSEQTIMFYSSNPKIVSIKKTYRTSALIRARKVGTATIQAVISEGDTIVSTLNCKIKVTPPGFSVRLPMNKIVLYLNDTYILDKIMIIKPRTTAEIPRYLSLNSYIATISPRGIITAKQPGTTKIKAFLSNGKYDTCKIIVKKSSR